MRIKIFHVEPYVRCGECSEALNKPLSQEITDWEEIKDSEYYTLLQALKLNNKYRNCIVVKEIPDQEKFIKTTIAELKSKLEKEHQEHAQREADNEKKKLEAKAKAEKKRLKELLKKYPEGKV